MSPKVPSPFSPIEGLRTYLISVAEVRRAVDVARGKFDHAGRQMPKDYWKWVGTGPLAIERQLAATANSLADIEEYVRAIVLEAEDVISRAEKNWELAA